MNVDIIRQLFDNAALLLVPVLLLSTLLQSKWAEKSFARFIAGVLLGVTGIAIMMAPKKFAPGVIFDTRSVLLSLVGLFFGPLPTLIAVLMTGAYRFYLGGAGALTGISVIITSGGIGAAWKYLRVRVLKDAKIGILELYLLGAAVHTVMLLLMVTLPSMDLALTVLKGMTLPVLLVYPLAILVLGKLLAIQQERKKIEDENKKLVRVYAVLSETNQMIVRTRDQGGLLHEVCRIAVETGGLRMAWIGLINPDSGRVDVAASAGETGDYLDTIDIEPGDPLTGGGPTGRAITTNQSIVAADIAHDNRMAPWRAAALKQGFRSSAAFPFSVKGTVRGTINLYAGETHFFDKREMKLFEELALDIGFAVEFIESEDERREIQESLRLSEERFRISFHAGPDSINLNRLADGMYIDINDGFTQIMGYSRDEVAGKTSIELHIWADPEDRARLRKMLEEKGEVNNLVASFRAKDGSIKIGQMSARILTINDEKVILSITRDITEQKAMEDEIRRNLDEKNALLKEIHHRVKNNLTVVSSLLSLQADQVTNTDVRMALAESRSRIFSIARVHEKLYQSDNFSRVDMKAYIEEMVSELITAFGSGKDIGYDLDIDDADLDISRAVPCGLILNELITNAVKYAFPDDRAENLISVSFKRAGEDEFELTVQDNGIGLPPDINIEEAETLGLTLVKILTQQINGELYIARNGGTAASIRFNEQEADTG